MSVTDSGTGTKPDTISSIGSPAIGSQGVPESSHFLLVPIQRGSWLWLAIAFALFAMARFPFVMHLSGQMDEQWFAVPGMTMWEEGVPRIPYCPTKRRETYFENADKCIMALPPGLHYVQAPFFAFLKPGYPTARMPVFFGGFLLIGAVWYFSHYAVQSTFAIGLGTCMLAVSRPLMFTAVTARPDLLCALCGVIAMILMWRWNQHGKWRTLLLAGFVCGLGALFHPFALVYCQQAGIWVLWRKGTLVQRVVRGAALAGMAVLGISLWVPLIVRFPYEFQSQFFSNVLERSGPGIVSRLLWPWRSLRQHWIQQWDFNEPYQFLFLLGGLVVATAAWLLWRRDPRGIRYLLLVGSAVYFTATMAGVHPTKGYWLYPIALLYPLAVDGIRIVISAFIGLKDKALSDGNVASTMVPSRRIASYGLALGLTIGLAAIMVPGSGIRTTWTYLKHWGNPRFHGEAFIAKVLEKMPTEGLFMSDVSFVFDIYLSGRKTILCQPRTRFWGSDELGIDYLFVGQEGIDYFWPEEYETKFLRREGSTETPQDCFVDIHVPIVRSEPNKP